MDEVDEPLWDVVEEQLDEAEFSWESWERSLVAPNYTLDEVATLIESRLAAHVDGLVIGGEPVAEKVLIPALEAEDDHRVCAAAAALLATPGEAGLRAVVEVLHDLPDRRAALVRGLACAERLEVLQHMRSLLADVDEAMVGAAAEVLLFHDEPLGEALAVLLASEEPRLRALGLRALPGEASAPGHVRAIQAGLGDDDRGVVDAAIEAGVVLAPALAWRRVRERASEADGALALLWLALRDQPDDRAAVLAALQDPQRRMAALVAASYVGAPEVIDASLEWLEDRQAGPLIGEMVTAMTGVDLEDAGLTAPANEDEEALTHSPEDDLPRPAPMALYQWWLRERPRFADGQRWLGGNVYSAAAIVEALTNGPMRRRAWLLRGLRLRAPRERRLLLQTRAPASRQRRQLDALAGAAAGLA